MAYGIRIQDRKNIHFKHFTECYLTIRFDSSTSDSAKKFFADLEEKGLKIVRMMIFGKISESNKVGEILKAYPSLILENSTAPKKFADMRSAEIFAVDGKFDRFEYVESEGKRRGAYFKIHGCEYLYVSGLGLEKVSQKMKFGEEAKKVYSLIDDILFRHGFSPRNVYRFWNCMENILENHSENYNIFNEVRDGYFKKHGITDFPAATGIEARLTGRQRINLSFEAVKTKRNEAVLETLHSDLQCEAWEYKKHKAWKYGPKFSRAKSLIFREDGIRKIYVSGTSNVDRSGRAIFLDDPEKNIDYVVSCVEHLLKQAGSLLDNVVSARVYFKNQKLLRAFQKLYRKNKWKFPFNALFVNICRKGFSFEMECVAVDKLLTTITRCSSIKRNKTDL